MRPDFWLERWNSDRIGFHQREINAMLRAQWANLCPSARGKVFVPLCGKSRDMLWLRERGHEILGIEFIEKAVRDFFAENGLTPTVAPQPPFVRWTAGAVTLLCGDFFDLTAAHLRDVGAVYDRASLIALPTDMRRRYVEHMAAVLAPGVETLLIVLSYPQDEMKGPPFSVTDAEVRTLYRDKFDILFLDARDALAENVHLRERGLSALSERAYRIRRLGGD